MSESAYTYSDLKLISTNEHMLQFTGTQVFGSSVTSTSHRWQTTLYCGCNHNCFQLNRHYFLHIFPEATILFQDKDEEKRGML
ncbi:hypothetical protein CHS0354_025027, partial [Potamilus streckersoni]